MPLFHACDLDDKWGNFILQVDLAADGDIVNQLDLHRRTRVEHLVERAIVDDPADVEQLLGDLVLHLLELLFNVEVGVLTEEPVEC